jgi:hypothetical protein
MTSTVFETKLPGRTKLSPRTQSMCSKQMLYNFTMMPATQRTTHQESMSMYRNLVPQALSHNWGQHNPNYCTNRSKFKCYLCNACRYTSIPVPVCSYHWSPSWVATLDYKNFSNVSFVTLHPVLFSRHTSGWQRLNELTNGIPLLTKGSRHRNFP